MFAPPPLSILKTPEGRKAYERHLKHMIIICAVGFLMIFGLIAAFAIVKI